MHKKLSILIGLFFLTVPILAQGIADNAEAMTEPTAYVNYVEGKVLFGDFQKVELNIIIQQGYEINAINGRVEIVLKGGGVIRLDRTTRIVFTTLTNQMIVLEAWNGNIYVEKGSLEIGIKSPNRSLNLSQSEWYLTKPEKNFKKWNSKRNKELKQRYSSESDYGCDHRSYGSCYSLRRYGRYYPYYGGYSYYSSWTGLAILVGLNILLDRNYGYYYGGYYPYYRGYYFYYPGYGYSRHPRNYNPYNHSRGQTVIHKNQLQSRFQSRNTRTTQFKSRTSSAQIQNQRIKAGNIVRKKITPSERTTFSAIDYLSQSRKAASQNRRIVTQNRRKVITNSRRTVSQSRKAVSQARKTTGHRKVVSQSRKVTSRKVTKKKK